MPCGFHLLLQICSPPFYTMLCAPGGQPAWTGSKDPPPLACCCLLPMGSTSRRSDGRRTVKGVFIFAALSLWGCPEQAAALSPIRWLSPLVSITTHSLSPLWRSLRCFTISYFPLLLPHTFINGPCIELLTSPKLSVLSVCWSAPNLSDSTPEALGTSQEWVPRFRHRSRKGTLQLELKLEWRPRTRKMEPSMVCSMALWSSGR